ncbi:MULTISPECIES: DEAD/DEAH box helicase [Salinibaculum]|uniref:DEAD/DEAH box helicase n=1 Tax=Salinibaculum TaxID=2732368 RepID=UPI0030D1CF3F
MTDPEPADRYLIGGAGLPTTMPDTDFPHEPARQFQATALAWIHDTDAAPVATLEAPTGSGKTAVIAALSRAMGHTLCLYPTNALVNAQAAELEAAGLDVQVVTSDTLSGTGDDRTRELIEYAQRGQRGAHDVIVTNPDILQAVLQGLYFSPGDDILRIYGLFDAAVFDEFHYYDALAASGLLTQIKVLSERGAVLSPDGDDELTPPRFLLSSATPDTAFIDHVIEDIGLSADRITACLQPLDFAMSTQAPPPDADLLYRHDEHATTTAQEQTRTYESQSLTDATLDATIEGTCPGDISRFRSPMLVNRYPNRIGDAFEQIAERLRRTVSRAYDGGGPIAAVIFNSAARSNAFYQFLQTTYDDAFANLVVKDNGYDTGARRSLPDEFAVLNTTSKGEVGLDFDVQRLVMASPFTASAFIQRIGRAGRQSPAIVDLYGLDDPTWPPVQSYPEFLQRVMEARPEPSTSRERLRALSGMRAAAAIHDRDEGHGVSDAVYADFGDFPEQSRWRSFLEDLGSAQQALDEESDALLGGPAIDRAGSRAVRAAMEAFKGLRSLRGRSVSHPVRYPRGDGHERTEYDLVRALQHYSVGDITDGNVLTLWDASEGVDVRGYYPGKPADGDGIDLTQASWDIEDVLTAGYTGYAKHGQLDNVAVSETDLLDWFRLVPLRSMLVPAEIRAGRVTITIETHEGREDNVSISRTA